MENLKNCRAKKAQQSSGGFQCVADPVIVPQLLSALYHTPQKLQLPTLVYFECLVLAVLAVPRVFLHFRYCGFHDVHLYQDQGLSAATKFI